MTNEHPFADRQGVLDYLQADVYSQIWQPRLAHAHRAYQH